MTMPWLIVGSVCGWIAAVICTGKVVQAFKMFDDGETSLGDALLTLMGAALVVTSSTCLSQALHILVNTVESSP